MLRRITLLLGADTASSQGVNGIESATVNGTRAFARDATTHGVRMKTTLTAALGVAAILASLATPPPR